MRDRLLAILIAAFGFVLYVLTSYPFPDWLDSPELMTAAFRLGVFHPPGSPLAVILGHLFSLWPCASPATSLLYFSALFAAGCLYVLARSVQDLWRGLGPKQPVLEKVVTIGATSAFALSPGLWSQAVRTEVYTLALLLFLIALRELLAMALHNHPDRPDLDQKRIRRAAAACGMGLAVHPLMALPVVLGFLPLALSRARRRSCFAPRNLMRTTTCFALGAAPLLLLPFMVHTNIDLRWGDPSTVVGWFQMILGTTFSHSFLPPATPAAGVGLQTLAVFVNSLGLPLALLALLGLYPLLRTNRRLGFCLILIAGASALTLLLQRSVRLDNPDVTGYALPGAAVLFLVAAGGLAVAARLLAKTYHRGSSVVALATLGLAVATLLPDPAAHDRSGCTGSRHLATGTLKRMPANTLILTADFNLVFMFDYLTQVEGIRPDIRVIYLRDLNNDALRAALAREDATLNARLPRAGDLDRSSLLKLAAYRPVALDLGPHLQVRSLAPLRPKGLLWLVTPGDLPDEKVLLDEQRIFYANLAPPVCKNGGEDPRTAEVVTWHAYWQAVGAYELGLPTLANQMLAVAWCAGPEDRTIATLAERPGLSRPLRCPQSRAVRMSFAEGSRPSAARAVTILLGLLAWLTGLLGLERKNKHSWLGLSLAGVLAMAILLALA
jgi:hypothetical protein